MMEVKININTVYPIADLRVVRISPTEVSPDIGEECVYDLYSNRLPIGQITHPFGDGRTLAIKMLEELIKHDDE